MIKRKRLFSNYPAENPSRESLIETLEILSDHTLMKGIKEGLEEEGGVPLEDFEIRKNVYG